MEKDTVLELLYKAPEFTSLLDGLKRGYTEQMVHGATASIKSYLMAGLRGQTGRPSLIITSTIAQAERLREDMSTWLPEQEAVLFPPMEYLPFEVVAHSPEVVSGRLYVLERLIKGDNLVVVAPVAALYRSLTPHEIFRESLISLRSGQAVGRDDLVRRLVRQGYERVDMVEGKGHLAVRGEIVDLFPLASDYPYRIAFWGDEIDEIRQFDPATQRSREQLKEISIGPAREFILPVGDITSAGERIRKDLDQTMARLRKIRAKQELEPESSDEAVAPTKGRAKLDKVLFDAGDAAGKLQERVESHLAKLEEGLYFPGLEQYANFFYDYLGTLIDYFPEPPLVLVDEPTRIKEASSDLELRDADRQTTMVEKGGLLPGQLGLYMNYTELLYRIKQQSSIFFSALGRGVPGLRPQNEVGLSATNMQEFHGQWTIFRDELQRWRKQNYRIVILTANADRRQRLREVMRDADIESGAGSGLIPTPLVGAAWVGVGSLEGGFQWPGLRLVVVTDGEIYGRPKKRRRPILSADAAPGGPSNREVARLASYQDLKIGDYVVHVTHGIGKYLGVQSELILGATRDYLVIKYDGTDRLKIPTEQIDQIQKYIGADGHEPKLNRLGGSEWARVKSRVKESIREMAAELLRLAAMRESVDGYPFPADSVWQKDFEDAFPYEETPDQLKAVKEIKADMESPRPMDRLLLGDVGYGKTEVALRAAFKAASDGRQVAILVPTTILAQQHFATCKSRMEGFPLNVAVLNRFRSAKEQNEILKGLSDGTIEVVIGTHRLLGEDVRFKDLGLLVVDEEQRFGVQHKERIKLLKANVDVVTLTATPIPRTLHMAMVGMREMSVITSPPEDRYPVETFVAEFDEELIRDAIGRELSRRGQVFFVHNRIQTIDKVAARIQKLVPEARVVVAHGQMKEERLEQTVLDFMEGEYDVLVSTTIIENGVDIPQVNTILVDDADRLGLSQLYQLRGRVGRSNRLAYAYFMYRRDKVITEVAERRLRAIKDFTELGSGFKIALRDLEIRGAGNILGPEQHGFIITVGFDLYTQLLEEAVQELKGERPAVKEILPSIELPVDAFISDQYVADARQKIDAYKRVIAIRSAVDAADVAEELTDRFGALPDPVKNLLDIAQLKVQCMEIGVTAISQIKDQVTIKLLPSAAQRVALDQYLMLNRRPPFKGRIVAKGSKVTQFAVKVGELDARSLLRLLRDLLTNLQELSMAALR
jgi:transcription-repair coupling factor (superfamily II helicase)